MDNVNTSTFIGIGLAEITIVLLLIFVPMPIWLKMILFSAFSILTGFIMRDVKKSTSEKVLRFAVLSTIGIFIMMALAGVLLAGAGINLGWMGLILLGFLIGLLVANIVLLFVGDVAIWSRMVAIVGVVVFSIYILVDTNMMQRDYAGDFVMAAFDYYLDVINLVLSLIRADS